MPGPGRRLTVLARAGPAVGVSLAIRPPMQADQPWHCRLEHRPFMPRTHTQRHSGCWLSHQSCWRGVLRGVPCDQRVDLSWTWRAVF
jgi:hypothetical protein